MQSGKKIRLTCVDLWKEMDSWVMNDQHEIWSAPLPELNQMLLTESRIIYCQRDKEKTVSRKR